MKLGILPFLLLSGVAAAQIRSKGVLPVDPAMRQTFEKQVKVALLVGIGNYPQVSGLGRLKYPARDVTALAAELAQQGYLVRTLVDSDASRGVVRRVLRELADTAGNDHGTILFYFSGQGFGQKGVNYLATYGATVDDLPDEGLPIADVESILKSGHARQIVMLIDACRNDPRTPAKSGAARSFSTLNASQGLRALYSTGAGQVSYESDDWQSSVFTSFLVRGLKGEAARPDGLITFRDLSDYVVEQMRAWSLHGGSSQIPYEAGESSGDFLLARATPGASTPAAATSVDAPLDSMPAVKPSTAPPASTGPLMVGQIDVSRFAGLRGGDTVDQATRLFGKTEGDHGAVLYYGDGQKVDLSLIVAPPHGDSRVTGAVVFWWGKDWLHGKVEPDPLLNLMGQPSQHVISLLGPAAAGPRNGGDGSYKWQLPQGGDLSILMQQGEARQIALNWPKPAAPALQSANGPGKMSLRFSKVDVNHFASVAPGDTREMVVSKYGQPIGPPLPVSTYGADRENLGLEVAYAGNAVKSVTVRQRALSWIRAHGVNDPLMQLIGKTQAEVISTLGEPSGETTLLTGDHLLFWGLSIDGGPLPDRTNMRTDRTLTVSFQDGQTCSSVGIRW